MTRIIELTQGKCAVVDDEDYEWLNQWRWCFWRCGHSSHAYAMRYQRNAEKVDRRAKRKVVSMHQAILRRIYPKLASYFLSDHINGNTLDNRRGNLRLCTAAQNAWNSRGKDSRRSSSQYKGVSYRKPWPDFRGIYRRHRQQRPWSARICVNGKIIHLGSFYTELRAAQSYNEAAIYHFGEFARLNNISPPQSAS